jgi:hypothetical protein
LYGAATCKLQRVEQKYLESFEMWCWRRIVKISCTECVRNEEVLRRVKENRNILHTIKIRKANRIGQILHSNCLLKYIIEEKKAERIEVTGRRGRRCKQLLNDLKKTGGYWKLKEAPDRTLWRICFERRYRPALQQATE